MRAVASAALFNEARTPAIERGDVAPGAIIVNEVGQVAPDPRGDCPRAPRRPWICA
jgi:hypothetical protein